MPSARNKLPLLSCIKFNSPENNFPLFPYGTECRDYDINIRHSEIIDLHISRLSTAYILSSRRSPGSCYSSYLR